MFKDSIYYISWGEGTPLTFWNGADFQYESFMPNVLSECVVFKNRVNAESTLSTLGKGFIQRVVIQSPDYKEKED